VTSTSTTEEVDAAIRIWRAGTGGVRTELELELTDEQAALAYANSHLESDHEFETYVPPDVAAAENDEVLDSLRPGRYILSPCVKVILTKHQKAGFHIVDTATGEEWLNAARQMVAGQGQPATLTDIPGDKKILWPLCYKQPLDSGCHREVVEVIQRI
jgi:hypothetical protein